MASGIQSGIKDFITYQSPPILSLRFPPSLDIFIKVIKTKEMMIMPDPGGQAPIVTVAQPIPRQGAGSNKEIN